MVDATVSDRIRVLVVVDSDDPGSALEHLLRASDGIACVGHVTDAEAMLTTIREGATQVVLGDLTMPGLDPFEAIAELKRIAPLVRVIAFSGYDDDATQRRAKLAGAEAFLATQVQLEEITRVIHALVGSG